VEGKDLLTFHSPFLGESSNLRNQRNQQRAYAIGGNGEADCQNAQRGPLFRRSGKQSKGKVTKKKVKMARLTAAVPSKRPKGKANTRELATALSIIDRGQRRRAENRGKGERQLWRKRKRTLGRSVSS